MPRSLRQRVSMALGRATEPPERRFLLALQGKLQRGMLLSSEEEKQLGTVEQGDSSPAPSTKVNPVLKDQVERTLVSLESLHDPESRKLRAHLAHWLRRQR